jgi:hypothetical protein
VLSCEQVSTNRGYDISLKRFCSDTMEPEECIITKKKYFEQLNWYRLSVVASPSLNCCNSAFCHEFIELFLRDSFIYDSFSFHFQSHISVLKLFLFSVPFYLPFLLFLVFIFTSLFMSFDRLCGLLVRVLGYSSGGPGSIPGTTRKRK